jgi:hypothetical protein
MGQARLKQLNSSTEIDIKDIRGNFFAPVREEDGVLVILSGRYAGRKIRIPAQEDNTVAHFDDNADPLSWHPEDSTVRTSDGRTILQVWDDGISATLYDADAIGRACASLHEIIDLLHDLANLHHGQAQAILDRIKHDPARTP